MDRLLLSRPFNGTLVVIVVPISDASPATNSRDRGWNREGHGGAKMSRKPTVEEGLKESKPKLADDQSHKPAKHIEETARLASSVETARIPLRSDAPKIDRLKAGPR